jgi:hypothetical protein
MAKLVDARDLKSLTLTGIPVRFRVRAPFLSVGYSDDREWSLVHCIYGARSVPVSTTTGCNQFPVLFQLVRIAPCLLVVIVGASRSVEPTEPSPVTNAVAWFLTANSKYA